MLKHTLQNKINYYLVLSFTLPLGIINWNFPYLSAQSLPLVLSSELLQASFHLL